MLGGLLPVATEENNGLYPIEYRRRVVYSQMPLINTQARLIAEYHKTNTYYGHAIRIFVGSFKTSCNLILWCDHATVNYNFTLKGYGVASVYSQILITETDSKFLIYISGSYNSQYSACNALIESTSDIFKPVDDGELVQISSLSPIKNINIKDCLIGA